MLRTKFLMVSILMSLSPLLVASWPSAISFTVDNNDAGSGKRNFTINGVSYDRCDAASVNYTSQSPAPNECHRWGLVWNTTVITTAIGTWSPGDVTVGYRLPTIKELIRLFDYTGGTGIEGEYVIYSKFDNEAGNTTLTVNDWFISSTYRDLDKTDNGNLQIMAINIVTGEVRGVRVTPLSLSLCNAIGSDGDCGTENGHKFYRLLVKQ